MRLAWWGEYLGPRQDVLCLHKRRCFHLRAVCVLWPLSCLLLKFPVSVILFPSKTI